MGKQLIWPARKDLPSEFAPADWLLKAPHRPPNDLTAEKMPHNILAAVGYVASLWESFETILSQVFASSFAGTESKLLSSVYGSIASFSGRLDVLDRVTAQGLSDEKREGQKNLIADIRRCSALRNLVAHSLIAVVHSNGLYVLMPLTLQGELADGHGFQLVTAPYNSIKTQGWMHPTTYYTSPTIHLIAKEIEKIAVRTIGAFNNGEIKRYLKFEII